MLAQSLGDWIGEISVAFVPIVGALIVLVMRMHYKKVNSIEALLNNVEIDLMDGEYGHPPSIREKLNLLSDQLKQSMQETIDKIENDRRLDRREASIHHEMVVAAFNDMREDIDLLRNLLTENKDNIEETKEMLAKHMTSEISLMKDYLDGKITEKMFVERFEKLHSGSEDLL